ncbi:MAG: hypothetical protein ICV69_08230 [Thermoleophilaceae bacterium]|nr:hypothetical protein [Thermoleophilaceae bacterium]
MEQLYAGVDGMEGLRRGRARAFENYVLEAAEIIDAGDHVVVVQRMSGRGRGGDRAPEVRAERLG